MVGSDEPINKISNDDHHSSGDEEEESHTTIISNATRSSPLTFSRLLSRSRSSLPLVDDNLKQEKVNEQPIILTKDYNPASILLQVETSHAFINKVSHDVYKAKILNTDALSNQKQTLASARMKEQQILGCLIVEIFLAEKFRAIWKVDKISFANRLNTSLNVIKNSPNGLPKCVQNAVMLLLRVDSLPKTYNIDFSETPDYGSKFVVLHFFRIFPAFFH